jgi:hypothetical protein
VSQARQVHLFGLKRVHHDTLARTFKHAWPRA